MTNVPGPQLPLYLLGAPLHEAYPIGPLFQQQALVWRSSATPAACSGG